MKTLKENICIGLAKHEEAQKNKDQSLSYYLKAMAFRMGALSYEGEYIGNFMHLIKAHGKGKITYQSGLSYQGNFVDGKIQENGEVKITYPDKSVFKGNWRNKVLEG